jgi:acetyltransferase
VGASTSPEKLGNGIARNLTASGFAGAIHFVGQKPGELFGRQIYTNLAQVPDPVDLAVLVVPNTAVPETIRACARRGIRAAIVVSAGFREAGPEGAALERECIEIAHAQGMRLLGPNCIGTIDTHLPLDTTFLQPPMPTPGGIAFISHSGAFCAAVIDWSRRQGFGFSQIVSLGNQADLNETDVLPAVAEDEHTRLIVLYMEGVSDGRRFVEAARRVTLRKPVIALKVGRSISGQHAAASHTGALASSDAAFDAAFAKAGVFRADTAEQMFDWARALEACPLPVGRRAAVLTNAGGPGVIAADALEAGGMELARLSGTTRKALAGLLPPAAGTDNPVDMLASAAPAEYAGCLKLLLDDPGVDSALVILPPPPMFTAESVAQVLIPLIRDSGKPVLVALMGSTLIESAKEAFELAGLPTYPFPERAASALGILARRAEFLNQGPSSMEDGSAALVNRPTPTVNATSEELLEAYGIAVAPLRLATSAEQAASIAAEIGFPVVMKIASPEIAHKSDAGGVLLNVKTRAAATRGYSALVERARGARPDARLEGVHLQKQVPDGQDVIMGIVRDPQFGPLVMFGSGGIEVEALHDTAFALAPLSQSEADALIGSTWAGRKLSGFRSIPPADREAVRAALVRLSRLACDIEGIMEIEVNPLRALAAGAVALDVRMKWDAEAGHARPSPSIDPE